MARGTAVYGSSEFAPFSLGNLACTANNAAVLTGSSRYRLKYFASRYSVIVAVTFVVTLLSWRERLGGFG